MGMVGQPDGQVTDRAAQHADPEADGAMAPGGHAARALGCLCPDLVNAAHRAGAAEPPCIDPRCTVHAISASSDDSAASGGID
jgi:hypothetical protein